MAADLFSSDIALQNSELSTLADLQSNIQNNIQQNASSEDEAALQQAAEKFEAIFVRMMLKSMRQASDVLADENSPMNSEYMKFYRDMHDQQIANDLASSRGMGLADLIVQQLGPPKDGYIPASILRSDGNLPFVENAPVSKQADFADEQAFVDALNPIVEPIANELGLHPDALIAQAALETGWGQYMVHDPLGKSSNNLFGIKADDNWQGQKTRVPTIEFDGARAKKQVANFKVYDSLQASVQDYAAFLSQARYQQARAVSDKPEAFFSELQKAGYATDPAYAEKVVNIMKRLGE
jgi:flagellar protein FlgJ